MAGGSDRRWVVEALGDAAAYGRLARGMAGTELWSLLLEVVRERARARTPAEVLRQHREDAFVRPAPVDQRTSVEVDAHLLAAAAAFEAIELSPVAPLGACSTVALTDQGRVLSALRGAEVVSDTTNVLALEIADRLSRAPEAVVRLATSHRVVRAQPLPVPTPPGFSRHFRLFALATGGRERREHGLVVEAIAEHVRAMLAALARLEARGYAFGRRRLELLARGDRAVVGDRIAAALGGAIEVARRPLEHAYYSGGVRYMLWVTREDGGEMPLIDGGAFDWLARLRSDAKCAFVASGMGAQLVPMVFRKAPPS